MILVAPLNLRVIDKGLRVCDGVDSLHTPRSSWDIFFPSSTTIDDMHPGGAPKLSLDHKLVCMVRTWNLPIETTQSWSGVKVHTICKVCTFHFLSLCPPLIHHLFSTIKKKKPSSHELALTPIRHSFDCCSLLAWTSKIMMPKKPLNSEGQRSKG